MCCKTVYVVAVYAALRYKCVMAEMHGTGVKMDQDYSISNCDTDYDTVWS